MDFDENKCLEFIRQSVPNSIASLYDDDDLLNIVDLIWDFYESRGLLELDTDNFQEDEEDILPELLSYAARMLRKDKYNRVLPEHVEPIILAEIAYEDTLSDL